MARRSCPPARSLASARARPFGDLATGNRSPQRGGFTVALRIGIDLGGTKIEGLALAEDGSEIDRRRVAAPRGSYEDSIRAIVGLVTEIESAGAAASARQAQAGATVGVGIPGAISPASGLIKNANSTWLIGRPLAEDLARALSRPVRLANEAN